MEPKAIIFFGRSGSGKGTQAQLLIDHIKKNDPQQRDVLYIETGERFRDFMSDNNNFTSNMVNDVLDRGGLLPEFLPIWIWTGAIVKNYTGVEHMVFDGVARRENEAPTLAAALEFYGIETKVLFMNTSREWSTERLLNRDRADDNKDDIKHRLDWFDENTLPAVNYFRNHIGDNFLDINGEQTIEEVHEEIIGKLF